MKCKAYNPSCCLKHCETYKEAMKFGWQCCIFCYYGKNKNGCPECNLEYRKDYNMENVKIFSMVTGEEGIIESLDTRHIEITGFNEGFIELG
ncbi:MAG: hypothetical protein M0Q13_15430 [Methanothrix sp.]|jgi:hypothetical protein|nr:hypothetical protein [Methanothrix sp.]